MYKIFITRQIPEAGIKIALIFLAFLLIIIARNAFATHTSVADGDCTGSTDAGWECVTINSGSRSEIDFDNLGKPWIAFASGSKVYAAHYIGNNGDCSGGGGAMWDCMAIYDFGANISVGRVSLSFDKLGKPWVSFSGYSPYTDMGSFHVARFVGGGGDCNGVEGAMWDCMQIGTSDAGAGIGDGYIAFDPNGIPWAAYGYITKKNQTSAVYIHLAKYLSGNTNGDCPGVDGELWDCIRPQEDSVLGKYNFAYVGFDTQGNPWVAATLTYNQYENAVSTPIYKIVVMRKATGTGNCWSSTGEGPQWECMTVEQGTGWGSMNGSAMAFDKNGTSWLAFYSNATSLSVAKYVGSGGDCTGSGGSKWDCSIVDNIDAHAPSGNISIGIDGQNIPWVAYTPYSILNSTDTDLKIARYVGLTLGAGCTGADGAAWSCKQIDSLNKVGWYPNVYVQSNDDVWVTFHDLTKGTIRLTKYASGGAGSLALSPPVTISDGDLVREQGSSEIWLIKKISGKTFKRHILTDAFGLWYPYLSPFWSKIKVVPNGSLADAQLSAWVRLSMTSDPSTWKIYEVNGDGTAHWITCADPDHCGTTWLAHGGDPDGIYTINSAELKYYIIGLNVFLQ